MDFVTEEENANENENNDKEKEYEQNNNINNNSFKVNFISREERERNNKIKEIQDKKKEKEIENNNKKNRRLFIQQNVDKKIKTKNNENINKQFKKPKKVDKKNNDELDEIKKYYLGIKPVIVRKKLARKETIREFFSFNWDLSDDTTKNINSAFLPKNTSLLFGRGALGGIDKSELKKQSKNYYEMVKNYNNKNKELNNSE